MKHFVLSIIFAVAAQLAVAATDIIVASDIHLIAPELTGGKSWQQVAANAWGMPEHSDELMAALADEAIAQHAKLVLLSGDLTHNGEHASHERMVQHLDRLAAAGVATLVIPGNHDCNNPYSRSYAGDAARQVPTVDRDEFARLYARYGYGNGADRDPNSLSWAAEPIAGLVIVGIDTNRDRENLLKARGDSTDSYHNAGVVAKPTLDWAVSRISAAKQAGKRVLVTMHHHLMEHFNRQRQLQPSQVIAGSDATVAALLQAGAHTVLSGHVHITDAARGFAATDSITEAATGSLQLFPFNYRTITLGEGNSAQLATRQLAPASIPGLLAAGEQRAATVAAPMMLDAAVRGAWSKFQGKADRIKQMAAAFGMKVDLPQDPAPLMAAVHQQCDSLAAQALLCMLRGNEGRNPKSAQLIQDIKSTMTQVLLASLPSGGEMVRNLITESVMPEVDVLLRSLLQDINHCGEPHQTVVDDHNLEIIL